MTRDLRSAWCRPCGMPPRPSGRCPLCGTRLLPPGTIRIGDRFLLPIDQRKARGDETNR